MAVLIIGLAIAGVVILSQATPARAAAVSPLESPPVETVSPDTPPELVDVVQAATTPSDEGVSVIGAVATAAAVATIATVASRLLSSFHAQKARIAAEGTWAGQIRVFLSGVPDELMMAASVRDMAQAIVTSFGFGGSWRIGFLNPIQGMAFVLTAPFQRTLNLRAINSTYQSNLRKAAGVSRDAWRTAVAKVAMGFKFNPIIALRLEPWASEMKAIARGEF